MPAIPACSCRATRLSAVLCGLMLMLLSGCGSESGRTDSSSGTSPAGRTRPDVVTTTGMVTDIVRILAEDDLQVQGLIGEGVDPHLFTPGRNDVRLLMNAPIVIYSGLLLEGRMQQQLEQLRKTQDRDRLIFAVTECLEPETLLMPPEFEGHPDPHVWMDVSRWSRCVRFAAEQLGRHHPNSAAAFKGRAESYCSRLSELDDYIRQVISSIPESQRFLVTAHDAFEYFAIAYGIQVRSIQGISTDSQAAVADINDLVDFIVTNRIPAIFVESSVPEKNVQAVIEGCADREWDLQIGGELFSDAMGPPGTYEGTYVGMMDHNATTIARALGGEAPPQGWQGRLSHSAAMHGDDTAGTPTE